MSASAIPHAPYASDPARSRGRLIPEPESATRTPFQRDRDRIIHATAFRRLKHKTQVFVQHEGDHYRTRLTHSLEVAQIARSIARTLGLDEDLAEALALAHDLGHPPFGHAGEEALDLCMQPFGGFDHNEQTFRVLTLLEKRYPTFDGLNLTWETLEGIVKHNGPLTGPHAGAKARTRPVPRSIAEFSARWDLELAGFASLEAQVAAVSDDIAYNNHDIDDGLRAGLFSLEDLADVPLAGPIVAAVRREHPAIETERVMHETVRRMIGEMVEDVIRETQARIAAAGVKSAEDVRRGGHALAGFSDAMRANDVGLKRFLFRAMYRHERVTRMTEHAKVVVAELFDRHLAEPGLLPEDWRAETGAPGDARTARVVADYIAGMTDNFAFATHERLGGTPP
ncbi:MAG TPA: deoxyguanosinetriphosphate triphosphohydrolase [Dongiaceae bacterium]|jgi:dGTPase|nr:deoxyguanosinetriphosphate triphosphohydrolase [Dongiaceae bacterium]